jgi:hypothetical protein
MPMTLDDGSPRKRSMTTAVMLSLALHFAAIHVWRITTAHPHAAEVPESRLTVQLIPLQALQKLVEKTLPRKEEPRPDKPKPTPKHERHTESTPATEQTAVAMPEPIIEKKDASGIPLDTGELSATMRRDIGRIDRELRKEHPNLQGAQPGTSETKLARDIAASGKFTGGLLTAPTVEEIGSPDGSGRRVYKVSSALGHYCVTYESVGRRDEADPASPSYKTPKITNCPGEAHR